jgi:hypothetical protein
MPRRAVVKEFGLYLSTMYKIMQEEGLSKEEVMLKLRSWLPLEEPAIAVRKSLMRLDECEDEMSFLIRLGREGLRLLDLL